MNYDKALEMVDDYLEQCTSNVLQLNEGTYTHMLVPQLSKYVDKNKFHFFNITDKERTDLNNSGIEKLLSDLKENLISVKRWKNG